MPTVTYGCVIPQGSAFFGVGGHRQLVDLALVADESQRLDAVWVGDSLTAKARAESLTCLSVIAGMTTRVRLGVGCLASFALRDPALFAYQWASLDQLSGGRTLLSVCNGLQKGDNASAAEGRHFGNIPDGERVRRLEEFIPLVRQLWSGQEVTFCGSFASYDRIRILPTPTQTPCPIWISSNPAPGMAATERQFRRIARLADGWFTTSPTSSYLSDLLPSLAAALEAEERDIASFPIGVYYSYNIGPDLGACFAEVERFFSHYYGKRFFDRATIESLSATGPPERCAHRLRRLIDQGATHIALRAASWNQREQLERLVTHVLPMLA